MAADRQPGGRRAAPGGLALVQAFVNTNYDLDDDRHGEEILASPHALADWVAARGLIEPGRRASAADLERALAVREGLRALLIANNGGPLDRVAVDALNGALGGSALGVELGADGPRLEPARAGVPGALARIVALAAAAMLDGTWRHFKACRQSDCRWAFYDHSRNQSGRWCSMAVCGGRSKARAYYRRHRDTEAV